MASKVRDLPLPIERVSPAWYTSVMGTGILAIGVANSPVPVPDAAPLAVALFVLAVGLFAGVTALFTARILMRPASAFTTLASSVTMHAWGAPPMAAFTLAVGFLRIGEHVVPAGACITVAQWLFALGIIGSIATVFTIPFRLFTTHDVQLAHVDGTWLLAIVPPIVASVPAALLSPTWPLALRGSMLALAYGLLGTGTLLAALVIAVFFMRLIVHKVPDAPLVPAMWIVVGPLGQSIAGIMALGSAARAEWPAFGAGLAVAGLAYGTVMWGFAMYWLAMAIALTLRALRSGIPFSPGWWAFTFPVGVLTAGTVALDRVTHAPIYAVTATALLALLAALWTLVAARSVHAMWRAVVPARGVRALTAAEA